MREFLQGLEREAWPEILGESAISLGKVFMLPVIDAIIGLLRSLHRKCEVEILDVSVRVSTNLRTFSILIFISGLSCDSKMEYSVYGVRGTDR